MAGEQALEKAKAAARAAVESGDALEPQYAVLLFIAGIAPAQLRVSGNVQMNQNSQGITLPPGLEAETLNFNGSRVNLPPNLTARRLLLNQSKNLTHLPANLKCQYLEMDGTAIRSLPDDLRVELKLDLTDCTELRELPRGFTTGALVLRGCTFLPELPEDLRVNFLDITGCTSLRRFPERGRVSHGRLVARDCANLEALAPWLTELSVLDLRNCAKLNSLPEGLRVSSWVDISGTGITRLPESMQGVGLRWRGVPVSEQIVFRPETLTANDVLSERNAEVRRIMLERLGFERFLQLANATILHRDVDLGGERRLLKVEMPEDEDLVCVSFLCPSTARQYVVRVPPTIETCHAAVAWMAGFDNPDDYKPVVET